MRVSPLWFVRGGGGCVSPRALLLSGLVLHLLRGRRVWRRSGVPRRATPKLLRCGVGSRFRHWGRRLLRRGRSLPPQPLLLLLHVRCISWGVRGGVRMVACCCTMERGQGGTGHGAA